MPRRRDAEQPVLLTVEEAARVLRIGRTKAYDMAREWRVTGGKAGLPVVDFGNVLRVPVAALAERLGLDASQLTAGMRSDAATPEATEPPPRPAPLAPARTSRTRRQRTRPTNQLDLFERPAS
jgi:Helix-turn-helix domain